MGPWCEQPDFNRYGFLQTGLSRSRLAIPPCSQNYLGRTNEHSGFFQRSICALHYPKIYPRGTSNSGNFRALPTELHPVLIPEGFIPEDRTRTCDLVFSIEVTAIYATENLMLLFLRSNSSSWNRLCFSCGLPSLVSKIVCYQVARCLSFSCVPG